MPLLKERQLDVIGSFLEGNDVVAVLPTGYGKSLCFLSPLISHEKDVPGHCSIMCLVLYI